MANRAALLCVFFGIYSHGTTAPSCPHLFTAGNSTCYLLVRIEATWPEALAYCEAYSSELAIIESREEQQFLTNYIKSHEGSLHETHTYWLGAADVMSEGDWQWAISLEKVTYTNWMKGTPNNGHGVEHCLAVSAKNSYQWDDENCENHHYFVCETVIIQ